jgi:hypothetical protein
VPLGLGLVAVSGTRAVVTPNGRHPTSISHRSTKPNNLFLKLYFFFSHSSHFIFTVSICTELDPECPRVEHGRPNITLAGA